MKTFKELSQELEEAHIIKWCLGEHDLDDLGPRFPWDKPRRPKRPPSDYPHEKPKWPNGPRPDHPDGRWPNHFGPQPRYR